MTEMLRVGGAAKPFEEMLDYTAIYIANTKGTWSYPAYDAYPGSPTDIVELQDLLAISLLNAGQKPIESYYGLQRLLPLINERLMVPEMRGSFAEATPETLNAIANLFGVLDIDKPNQVGMTKLAKVLHRKRPDLIPLFDENIRRCYSVLGDPPPVLEMKVRTRRDFCLAWLPALQEDLQSQEPLWQKIADQAVDPPISTLRALDMVGWKLGALPRRKRRGA